MNGTADDLRWIIVSRQIDAIGHLFGSAGFSTAICLKFIGYKRYPSLDYRICRGRRGPVQKCCPQFHIPETTELLHTEHMYGIEIFREVCETGLVYCRKCRQQVEDCSHFVPPLRIPPTEVFDPKVKTTLAYKKDARILEIVFKNGQVWQLFGVQAVMLSTA